MAVIALSRRFFLKALGAALLLAYVPWPLVAGHAGDVRTQISDVANSLTSGDAAAAMAPFDKSYAQYDKLTSYFRGLASLRIENEVEVTDEEDTGDGAKLTIAWELTLTDLTTTHTEHRNANINVHFVSRGGKWKIVDFSPIDIFDPLPKSHQQ